jgi:uncharacterized membrane protein
MILDSSRNFGGIGAILLLVAALGFFVEPLIALVGFVGAIFLLIALHGLADYYKERGIFNNALFSFVFLIVGVVATLAAFIYLFFLTSFGTSFLSLLYPGFNGDWTTLPNLTFNQNLNPTDLIPYFGPLLSVIAIIWVFAIISGFFAWRSLKTASTKTHVGLLSTGGLLLFVGALLAVVVIGLILMGIAFLLLAVGFFQIKPQPPQPLPPSPPQPTPV